MAEIFLATGACETSLSEATRRLLAHDATLRAEAAAAEREVEREELRVLPAH